MFLDFLEEFKHKILIRHIFIVLIVSFFVYILVMSS